MVLKLYPISGLINMHSLVNQMFVPSVRWFYTEPAILSTPSSEMMVSLAVAFVIDNLELNILQSTFQGGCWES